MNSFEMNKIALALLLTVLVVFGINGLTEVIFEEDKLEENAFPIEVAEAGTTAVAETAVEEGPSLADLLAVASVDNGHKVFKKCKACHTLDNGGKNLVGPNLWDIVGRAKGTVDGFGYSSGLTAKGGDWSYEDLDAFLKKPSKFIAKTKMSFAGLKKPADRAAVIAMLRGLSDTPIALPSVAVEAPDVDAAPTDAGYEAEPVAETPEQN